MMMSLFLLLTGHTYAQKLKSGDLTMLKGQKVLNIQYDYSTMEVGKFKTEAEYLKKGTDDRNAKKTGTGDEWAAKWNNDKAARYQPAFEEKFNDAAEGCGLEIKPGASDAKYTMILHTTFAEQGVETIVFGSGKSASIDFSADIIETAAPGKVLATIESSGNKPKSNARMTVGGVPVNKETYDAGARLTECYQTAGKAAGKFFCKEMK